MVAAASDEPLFDREPGPVCPQEARSHSSLHLDDELVGEVEDEFQIFRTDCEGGLLIVAILLAILLVGSTEAVDEEVPPIDHFPKRRKIQS